MAAGSLSLGVAFVAGLASFLAPCVLPVLPGYLAFVTGGASASRSRHALRTALFVLGFGAMFVAMGLLIGAVAESTAAQAAETWVERVGGALIILFGLVMLDLIRFDVLDREHGYTGKAPLRLGRDVGALALGAAFAVGWTPCVGPILASILVLAGVQGSAASGALLLATYALGLGIPFLVLGVAAEEGTQLLERFERVSVWIERVGGVILIAVGIAVFTGSMTRLTSYVVG